MKIELEAETIQSILAPIVEMQNRRMEIVLKVAENTHATISRIVDIVEQEAEASRVRREKYAEAEKAREQKSETEVEIMSIRKKIELLRMKRELRELEAEEAKHK